MPASHRLRRLAAAYLAAFAYASPAPAATEGCTTGEQPFACRTEAAFDRLAEMKDDIDAFKKGMGLYVLAGQCTLLDPNRPVFVEERRWFSARMRVRVKGELTSYWVMDPEISDKPCAATTQSIPAAPAKPSAQFIAAPSSSHYPTGPTNVKPLHAGQDAKAPACEYKPVMSDEDIARCRVGGH